MSTRKVDWLANIYNARKWCRRSGSQPLAPRREGPGFGERVARGDGAPHLGPGGLLNGGMTRGPRKMGTSPLPSRPGGGRFRPVTDSSKPLACHTCALTPAQAATLEEHLRGQGYEFANPPPPYSRFAASRAKVQVVFYNSGKLVVQGKETREFIEFVLEPLILKQARVGYEAVLNPEMFLPRIGVDESGKGDFFGPLCVAGVYVNREVVLAFQKAGVRDSKAIGSDTKIHDLAEVIRRTPGCIYSVVPIGNEAYNRLYSKMKSVNLLLAWGHARVIENLMAQRHQMNPPPQRAISDQFAADKGTVGRAIMALGREIELIQRHKAESDLAVAAASILARDEFVTRLKRMEHDFGMRLPKGASAQVDAAAKAFVEKLGAPALAKAAKTHFRTACRAQGLPEPPKTEWKRRTPGKSS